MTDREFLARCGIAMDTEPLSPPCIGDDEAEQLRLRCELLEAQLEVERYAASHAWAMLRALIVRHYGELSAEGFRRLMGGLT